MRKITLLFYLILIGAIVYLGACLAITELREATLAGLGTVNASLAAGFAAITNPIAVSPIYIQWSWLIWLCIGWFTLGIGIMLWHRRPQLLKTAQEKVYQHAPTPTLPQTVTEQATQPVLPEEPKKEEAVAK